MKKSAGSPKHIVKDIIEFPITFPMAKYGIPLIAETMLAIDSSGSIPTTKSPIKNGEISKS